MFAVRTTLTEILLEVTNEEIRNIATESLSKIRLKGMILHNTHQMDGSLAKDYNKLRPLRPIGYRNTFKMKHFILPFISFYSPIIDLNDFVIRQKRIWLFFGWNFFKMF